jgi:hypothetical protein
LSEFIERFNSRDDEILYAIERERNALGVNCALER